MGTFSGGKTSRKHLINHKMGRRPYKKLMSLNTLKIKSNNINIGVFCLYSRWSVELAFLSFLNLVFAKFTDVLYDPMSNSFDVR
jgi:hypothetical protein